MAPAIVHFVGASLAVLLAVPLALRTGAERRSLWLVGVGGLWGLFPDVHYVSPVFETQLRTLHESWVADLFAFHYTLDQPPFATNPSRASPVPYWCFVSVTVFTTGTAVSDPHGRNRSDPPTRHSIAPGYSSAGTPSSSPPVSPPRPSPSCWLQPAVSSRLPRWSGGGDVQRWLSSWRSRSLAAPPSRWLFRQSVASRAERRRSVGPCWAYFSDSVPGWSPRSQRPSGWTPRWDSRDRSRTFTGLEWSQSSVSVGSSALYPAVRRLVAPPGYGSSR